MKLEFLSTYSWVLLVALFMIGMTVLPAFGQSRRDSLGILGKAAPEFSVSKWINLPEGKKSFGIADTKGKITYLYFFQSWCPGCHGNRGSGRAQH